jgi:hypothetical protein
MQSYVFAGVDVTLQYLRFHSTITGYPFVVLVEGECRLMRKQFHGFEIKSAFIDF